MIIFTFKDSFLIVIYLCKKMLNFIENLRIKKLWLMVNSKTDSSQIRLLFL